VNAENRETYRLPCKVVLGSGRSVTLVAIHQEMTYRGLVEGTPRRQVNDACIRDAIQEARQLCLPGASPVLIPPAKRGYHRRPGDMDKSRSLSGEPAEFLPSITCIGIFDDALPAHDANKDYSELTIVWYQDRYAFPIDKTVVTQIRALEWDTLATDGDY